MVKNKRYRKVMHLDERDAIDKSRCIKSNYCNFYNTYYNKTNDQDETAINNFSFNSSDKNYEILIEGLEEFIDLSNSMSNDEKSEFKENIKKAKDINELIEILTNSGFSIEEKCYKILKKYSLKIIEECVQYGKKTKRELKEIVESKISLEEMFYKVVFYLQTHDISE